LRAAYAAASPADRAEVGRFDERAGIVMSKVLAKDMLSDLARRPWTLVRVGPKSAACTTVHRAKRTCPSCPREE
jgi:hypothetical protein